MINSPIRVNRFLFVAADFLSRPPGFYLMLIAMVLCTALVPFGMTNMVTYALSVAAIAITGVVLMQGYRDTAAIHAKLNEIIIALDETRNDLVGLEHADPEEIWEKLVMLEEEAAQINEARMTAATSSPAHSATRSGARQTHIAGLHRIFR